VLEIITEVLLILFNTTDKIPQISYIKMCSVDSTVEWAFIVKWYCYVFF